jgi:hypothetical protein
MSLCSGGIESLIYIVQILCHHFKGKFMTVFETLKLIDINQTLMSQSLRSSKVITLFILSWSGFVMQCNFVTFGIFKFHRSFHIPKRNWISKFTQKIGVQNMYSIFLWREDFLSKYWALKFIQKKHG